MTVGDRIRITRESVGLSQEELGKSCGTSKQTIYKYEKNIITNIPLDRVDMIARKLGVTTVHLMGWEGNKEKPTPEGELSISDAKRELLRMVDELTEEQCIKLKGIIMEAKKIL